MKTEQKEVFIELLQLGPTNDTLAIAASHIAKSIDNALRCDFASLLIHAGAQGPIIGDALIRTIQQLFEPPKTRSTGPIKEIDQKHLFNLFLNIGRADVDHESGEALQLAIKASCSELVQQIVAKQPSPESLGASLPWAMKLENRQESLHIIGILLQHPVSQDAVNNALIEAVKIGSSGRCVRFLRRFIFDKAYCTDFSFRSLTKLLPMQACVDQNCGEPLKHAVRNSDLDTLQLLLGQGPSFGSLSTTLTESLMLPPSNTSRSVSRAAV